MTTRSTSRVAAQGRRHGGAALVPPLMAGVRKPVRLAPANLVAACEQLPEGQRTTQPDWCGVRKLGED